MDAVVHAMSSRQTPPADLNLNRHRSPSPFAPYLSTHHPSAPARLHTQRSRSPIVTTPSGSSSVAPSPILPNVSQQPGSSSLSRAHSHSHSQSYGQIHQPYPQSHNLAGTDSSSHKMSGLHSPRTPGQTPTPVQQDTVVMTDQVSLLCQDDNRRNIINHYLLGPKLGSGQHGEVYKGYDMIRGNRVVAIKTCKRKNKKEAKWEMLRQRGPSGLPNTRTLNKDGRPQVVDNLQSAEKKILREIAIMKKCQHGQIVRLLEVINDKLVSKILLVMEYMGGGEVKWRDEHGHPCLRVDQTRRICRDVVLGLEYLHHQGIIHRDIKPANLLWTEDRMNVKITDFGVSHFSANQRIDVLKHSPGFREIMRRKKAERRSGQEKTQGALTRKRSVGVTWKGKGKARAEVDPDSDDDPELEAEVLAELVKESLDPILLDDAEGGLSRHAGTPSFLAPEIIWEFGEDRQKSLLARAKKRSDSAEKAKGKKKKSRASSRLKEGKGNEFVESRGRDGGDMDRAPAGDIFQQPGQDSDGDCGPPSTHRGTVSPFDPSSPQASGSSPPSSSPSAALLDWKDKAVPQLGQPRAIYERELVKEKEDDHEHDSEEEMEENDEGESNEEEKEEEEDSSDLSIELPPRPPITKAIDVWALGVTLYCLLFGRTPWGGGNEYQLYQMINAEDFTVDEKMGYDRVPTGGRDAARVEAKEQGEPLQSEGAIVIGLLERLLEKDCTKRITLEEVKSLPWITRDIPNPAAWLEETAPARHDPITVTGADEGVAVSSVRFRWWAGITKQFTRIRNAMPRTAQGRGGQQEPLDPHLGDLADFRRRGDASIGGHRSGYLHQQLQQQPSTGFSYLGRQRADIAHADAEGADADIDASEKGQSEYGDYEESEPPQSRSLSRPATPVTRLAQQEGLLSRKPSRSRRMVDAVERGVRKISRHGSSIHGGSFGGSGAVAAAASSGGSGGEQTPKRLKRRTVPDLMIVGSRARSRDSSRSQPAGPATASSSRAASRSRRRVVSGGGGGGIGSAGGYASCSNLTSPSTADFTSDGENGIFDEEDVRRVHAKEQDRVRELWMRDASGGASGQDSDSTRQRNKTGTRSSLAGILGWRPHKFGLSESASSLMLSKRFMSTSRGGTLENEGATGPGSAAANAISGGGRESRTSLSQRLARKSADEVGSSGRSSLGRVRSGRGRRAGSRAGTQGAIGGSSAPTATTMRVSRIGGGVGAGGMSMVASSSAHGHLHHNRTAASALASADELTSAMRAASWGDEYGCDYGFGGNPSGELELLKADDYECSDYGDYPYGRYAGDYGVYGQYGRYGGGDYGGFGGYGYYPGNGSGYYDGGDEVGLDDDDEMRLVGAGGILSHPVSGPSSPNSMSGVSVVVGAPQPDGFSLNAAAVAAAAGQLAPIQTQAQVQLQGQGQAVEAVTSRRRGASVSGYYNVGPHNQLVPASSPLAQTPLSAVDRITDGLGGVDIGTGRSGRGGGGNRGEMLDTISSGEPRFAPVPRFGLGLDENSEGEQRVPSSMSTRSGERVYGQGSMSFSVDAEVPDEDERQRSGEVIGDRGGVEGGDEDPEDMLFNVRCGPSETLAALDAERGRVAGQQGQARTHEHGHSHRHGQGHRHGEGGQGRLFGDDADNESEGENEGEGGSGSGSEDSSSGSEEVPRLEVRRRRPSEIARSSSRSRPLIAVSPGGGGVDGTIGGFL